MVKIEFLYPKSVKGMKKEESGEKKPILQLQKMV